MTCITQSHRFTKVHLKCRPIMVNSTGGGDGQVSGLRVTGPKGHRSESVGKLKSLGTWGPALTFAATDSSPHIIQIRNQNIVPLTLWTEDTMKFMQLEFFF